MRLDVRHHDPVKDDLFKLGNGLLNERGDGLVTTFSKEGDIWTIGFPESRQKDVRERLRTMGYEFVT